MAIRRLPDAGHSNSYSISFSSSLFLWGVTNPDGVNRFGGEAGSRLGAMLWGMEMVFAASVAALELSGQIFWLFSRQADNGWVSPPRRWWFSRRCRNGHVLSPSLSLLSLCISSLLLAYYGDITNMFAPVLSRHAGEKKKTKRRLSCSRHCLY